MPGLFIALSTTSRPLDVPLLRQSAEKLAVFSGETTICHESPDFFLAVHKVHPLGFSQAECDTVQCWVHGTAFPFNEPDAGKDHAAPADLALAAYLRHRDDFVRHLQGEYHIVVKDGPRILIANDRFGLRPLYQSRFPASLVLSPAVKGLLPLFEGQHRLNPAAVAALYAFNKIRLGNQTMIDGVDILPPSTLLQREKGGDVTTRTTWTLRYNDSMEEHAVSDEAIDGLVDAYRAAMTRAARPGPGRKVGISLSGGLDSRTMIGAVDPRERKHFSTHTYGLPDSDEVQLAGAVAAAAGTDHHVYPLFAQDFISHADMLPVLTDELDLFVQGAQHYWLKTVVPGHDVMMTGLDLDVTLGGIYMTPDVLAAKDDEDILALLQKRNRIFTEEELIRMSGPLLKGREREPYETARELVARLPQEQPAAKYDLFIHHYSMRRIIFLRYAQIRNYLETATPMLDYAFMDLVAGLPTRQRAGHTTFHPFINRLCPELCGIPYQRTTLPPSAPLRFWPEAVRIEQERENLYMRIWRDTGGKVAVPYRRYYTNFDEWLRESDSWIDYTDRLLLGNDTRLYAMDLAEPGVVREWINEHRSGAKSRRQQIVTLLSLESYLRHYFT